MQKIKGFIIIFLLTITQFGYAQTQNLFKPEDLVQKLTLIDKDRNETQLTVHLSQEESNFSGVNEAIELNENLILVSDLNKSVIEKNGFLNSEKSHVKSDQKRLGLFEIYGANRSQKIKTIVFISLQSAVSTFSYVFISGQKLEPALVASVVSTALNFYFGADPNRWDRILKWGQNQYENGLKKINKLNEKSISKLEFAGPLATTFLWRFGTGYMMSGISAWNHFQNEFATGYFISNAAVTAVTGVFISGTWESVLSKWNRMNIENIEGSPITSEQIISIRRNRALMAAVLFPLAYSGVQIANYGLGLMAMTGAVFYALENSKYKEQMRSVFKKVSKTSVFKKAQFCHQLF